MEEKKRNIDITRQNWQKMQENTVAGAAYYQKCGNILNKLAEKYLNKEMSVIDLGCADGWFTELVASYCKGAIGYEFSETMLQKARAVRARENIIFSSIDLGQRNWNLPSCQLAMCMGVLTYIYENDQMCFILNKVRKSLEEGQGGIFITRESLSKTKTFYHMTQNKFYSIYRSWPSYCKNFKECGFEFLKEIKLFEDNYVINAFRIWKRENL